MDRICDYRKIYEELTFITDFNYNTSLCLYKPDNRLFVIKREAPETESVYSLLSGISSPYLAEIYHIADRGDHIDVLQEYIPGTTLEKLLAERGTLPEREVIRITSDICDGLSVLHSQGLVHRDISPKNIIIGRDGSATIIDYGIARSYRADKTADTAILGTPGYAAPEQFGFSQSDSRTDIYAVGVLMNVMLTGELPNVKPADGAPGKIIKKCIEIDAKKRYGSIADLQKSLNGIDRQNGPADRLLSHIPGLNSKRPLINVLALLEYILLGLLTCFIFAAAEPPQLIGMFFSWLFLIAVPYICFHNFLGVWNAFPLTKNSSRRSQITVFIILGIVSIFIGLIIFGAVNADWN